MNFLKEIKALYDAMETNGLSSHAIALWLTLMEINNKTGWKMTFTVAQAVLTVKAGLSDSTFKRARQELHKKGYIEYIKSKTNQAPTYRMISLVKDYRQQAAHHFNERKQYVHINEASTAVKDIEEENSSHMSTEAQFGLRHVDLKHYQKKKIAHDVTTNKIDSAYLDGEVTYKVDQRLNEHLDQNVNWHLDPLYKQNINKTKRDKTVVVSSTTAVTFYMQHFGKPSPVIYEALLHWRDELGDELVNYALAKTVKQGVKNWSYVQYILTAWKNKGITTVEAARLEEQAFRKQKQQELRRAHGDHNVPDWFYEREAHRKGRVLRKSEQSDKRKKDEEAELDALLRSVCNLKVF